MSEPRITLAVAEVLRAFLDDVEQPRYGYELMRRTGYASGKLYPLLARLEGAGWLVREREQVAPAQAGRPARVLYRLSVDGAQRAERELAAVTSRLTPNRPSWPSPDGRPSPTPTPSPTPSPSPV